MYFQPMNLLIVLLVIGVAIAWLVVTSKCPEIKQHAINYSLLTLVTGLLIRSFANQWWAQLPLLAVAAGVWFWYLRAKRQADLVSSLLIAVVGVVLGAALRGAGIWLSLAVGVVAAAVVLGGLLNKIQITTKSVDR